jgi:hypothetical protein
MSTQYLYPQLYQDTIKDTDQGLIDPQVLMAGLVLTYLMAEEVVGDLAKLESIALDRNDCVPWLVGRAARPQETNRDALVFWIMQSMEGIELVASECPRDTWLISLQAKLAVERKRRRTNQASPIDTGGAMLRRYHGPTNTFY